MVEEVGAGVGVGEEVVTPSITSRATSSLVLGGTAGLRVLRLANPELAQQVGTITRYSVLSTTQQITLSTHTMYSVLGTLHSALAHCT